MPVDVIMPRLSDSMEEGTVLRWLKSVGDSVKRGDELVEIETDKANMTYESAEEGTLVEILAQEGDTLPIGEVIARIGDPKEVKKLSDVKAADGSAEGASQAKAADGDTSAAKDGAAKREPAPGRAETTTRAPEPDPQPSIERGAAVETDGRVKASPVARRMAGELGVELGRITGSGPGGRIVKADVEAAAGGRPAERAPAPTPSPAPPRPPAARAPQAPAPGVPSPETAKGEVQVVELNRLQATVARRMSESKATAPHFYLQMEIDMSDAVRVREQLKRIVDEERPAPTFNDMVVKACALALREFPRANGAYRDGKVEIYSRVNVGVAVAARDALVVPTIFDADLKSLGEIALEARALAARVRDGTVTPPELSGGTFSVSNLGMYGVDNFSAVINPPQAALLSVGAVALKPAVDAETEQVVSRHRMGVTLACDHRILYGADGAQFLGRVRDLLEQPLSLAL
jgi:pyruvate dehydrogenase E2 component (dihydrolipoamide acetyltransferase)